MLAATIRCETLSEIAAKSSAERNGGLMPADDALIIAAFVAGLQDTPPALVLRGPNASVALGTFLAHINAISDAETVEILYGEAHDAEHNAAAVPWSHLAESDRAELIAQAVVLFFRTTPALHATFTDFR
jgi:hypothetical protein